MNFAALISGGKDGIYSAKIAKDHGHKLLAFANLYPEHKDELDSHMFQTVGHEMIDHISTVSNIPVVKQVLSGKSEQTDKIAIFFATKLLGSDLIFCGTVFDD